VPTSIDLSHSTAWTASVVGDHIGEVQDDEVDDVTAGNPLNSALLDEAASGQVHGATPGDDGQPAAADRLVRPFRVLKSNQKSVLDDVLNVGGAAQQRSEPRQQDRVEVRVMLGEVLGGGAHVSCAKLNLT